MAYPFVPSPHVTRTGGRRIDLIVIHTMEVDERDDAALLLRALVPEPALAALGPLLRRRGDGDPVRAGRGRRLARARRESRRPRDRAGGTSRSVAARVGRRLLLRDARARRRALGRSLPRALDPGAVALAAGSARGQARPDDARVRERGVSAQHAPRSRARVPGRALPRARSRSPRHRRPRRVRQAAAADAASRLERLAGEAAAAAAPQPRPARAARRSSTAISGR